MTKKKQKYSRSSFLACSCANLITIPEIEKWTNLIIKDLTATEEMVKREIMQLKVNKLCGPDEIHPRLLIELADIISTPLGLLMSKTIKDGNIPEDWNKANISPIYKKGA